MAVTGGLSLAAGPAGTLSTTGTFAANLADGSAAMAARQGSALVLSNAPRTVLDGTRIGGRLSLSGSGWSGGIDGTGQLTATDATGKATRSVASLRMDAGVVAVSLPPSVSTAASDSATLQRPAIAENAGPQSASTADGTGSTTYTLSPAAYAFLTGQLGLPLGSSPTISGTLSGQALTLTVGAPGPLPLHLPAGVPAPSFGATTLTVDEATDTITLDAGASTGVTAALHVAIAHAATTGLSDGTDLTATLTLGNVPFVAGASVTLTGSLTWTGGAFGASMTGSLQQALPMASGAITLQPGTSLSIGTGSGLSVTGTAVIGSGQSAYSLDVAGSLTDLSNWSMSISGQPNQSWQPAPGLTLHPNFSAALTDEAGTIGFDLTSTETASWSPANGAMLAVTGFEVSNRPPAAALSCPQIGTGELWLDLRGRFGYDQANLTLDGDGCIDLTSKAFRVTTAASGDLMPGNPTFSLTRAALRATGNLTTSTFAITASADATVTASGGGRVSGSAVVSFAKGSILAGVQIADLSPLGGGMSGSAEVYVANRAINPFNPADYGLGDSPFPATIGLQAGVNVSLSYTLNSLPSNVSGVLSKMGTRLPSGVTLLAVAQLSTAGLSVSLDVNFGTRAGGAQLLSTNGTSFYLDDVTVGFSVGNNTSVSVSGAGYLMLPAMWKGGSPSELGLTVTASLSANSGTLNLNIAAQNWQNAFGVSGLRIGSLGGTIGISEYVTVALSANGVQLPTTWGPAVGLAPGATLSMNENLNPTQPVLNFSVTPNSNGVALTPLAVGYAGQIAAGQPLTPDQQNIVNSLQISQASFYLAPFGGTTATGDAIQPGIALAFQATVDGVTTPTSAVAAVDVSAPSVTVDAGVGGFHLGPITMGGTHLLITANPSKVEVKFNGSFLYGDYTLEGDVSLHVASTASGAQVSFKVKAGLSYYMTISAALQGTVSGDGTGATVNASAWAGFRINGSLFGSIRMTLNLPGGVSFTDNDDLYTLVMLFKNAGASIPLIRVALEKVGYSSFAIFNVLSQLGTYGESVLDTFFSPDYFDIWVQTPAGQLLVADVAGNSSSPGAAVITYSWNGGYNQDWQFVVDPYYPAGWYELVNRHSGLCLSTRGASGYPGTSLVQSACGGTLSQLWNIGDSPHLNTWYHFTTMAQPGYFRVMDVQDGYPWPSGTLDIWPYTGNWNQQFYLTNSAN